jgi:hypothetical protein
LSEGSPAIAKVQSNGRWYGQILRVCCKRLGWWQEACSICQPNRCSNGSLIETTSGIQKVSQSSHLGGWRKYRWADGEAIVGHFWILFEVSQIILVAGESTVGLMQSQLLAISEFCLKSVKSYWWLEKVQLGRWRGNCWPYLNFGLKRTSICLHPYLIKSVQTIATTWLQTTL